MSNSYTHYWVTGILTGVLLIGVGVNANIALAEDPPEPQIWTYDFGDEDGTHDSGESTTFLPSLQVDGGFSARVRVGGGEGSFELENPGNPNLGTFSQLRMTASSSTANNIFEIIEYDDASPTFYIRFTIRLIEGEDGLHEFFIGSGGNFGGNNSARPNGFSVLTWNFDSEGVTTERRTQSGSSSESGIGDSFELDQLYVVEIYGNNTSGSQSYYRDGEQHNLPSTQWSLWLNGEQVGTWDGQLDNLEEGNLIDSFRFQNRNSDDNQAQIEIDDIVYANHFPVYREITGDEGWRMLAAPTDDLDVLTLARQNQVKGIEGDEIDITGGSNLFMFDGSDEWVAPEKQEDVLESGRGFIWYLWDNAEELPSKPLPMGLVSKGDVPDDDVTVSLTSGEGNENWNLLGNPFGQDLDISDIGDWANNGGLENTTGHVWDHDDESYHLTSANGNKVAAFQGFFIENDDAESITIPEDATTDEATFYRESQDVDTRLISLKLSGTDYSSERVLTDHAANVYFTPEADYGWDMWSASKLMPLSDRYATLAFKGERDDETINLAQQSLPSDLENAFTVPLVITSTPDVSGSFSIDIESQENIPEEWEITIYNEETGESYNLKNESGEIEINADPNARLLEWNHVAVDSYVRADESSHHIDNSWTLTIDPSQATTSKPLANLPQKLTLNQNYPNPFNPVTTVSYELPEDARVELAVYDLMGRRVTTLVDEQQSAGVHEAGWDASGVASGTYMYRLTVDSRHIQTRTMTLLN